MKTIWSAILTCFLLFMILISCKKGDTSGNKEKIFVLAEITAGDSVVVPIGKSLLAGNGETIAFEKLSVASVLLSETGGPGIPLYRNTSADYLSNPASVYTGQNIIKPDQSYSLKVSVPGLSSVNAVTHVPSSFSVHDISAKNKDWKGKELLEFSFAITDQASQKNYYMFEAVKQLVRLDEYFFWQGVKYDYNSAEGQQVYEQASSGQDIKIFKDTIPTNHYLRLNIYTGDANTDNEEFSGSLDSAFHRIFLTDSFFNGGTYATAIGVDKTYFEASGSNQKGRVLIRIKSISRELYDYLTLYEKYRSEFGVLPPSVLSSPAGNIVNGLGVFGGSFKKEFVFYYDDL